MFFWYIKTGTYKHGNLKWIKSRLYIGTQQVCRYKKGEGKEKNKILLLLDAHFASKFCIGCEKNLMKLS